MRDLICDAEYGLRDGLLLLQDSDCGTVSHQNYGKQTSPSDNPVGRLKRIRSADSCGAL